MNNFNTDTHSSNLLKVTDVAAHQEGRGSHEEVQHSPGQNRDVRLLPGQRLGRGRNDRGDFFFKCKELE